MGERESIGTGVQGYRGAVLVHMGVYGRVGICGYDYVHVWSVYVTTFCGRILIFFACPVERAVEKETTHTEKAYLQFGVWVPCTHRSALGLPICLLIGI